MESESKPESENTLTDVALFNVGINSAEMLKAQTETAKAKNNEVIFKIQQYDTSAHEMIAATKKFDITSDDALMAAGNLLVEIKDSIKARVNYLEPMVNFFHSFHKMSTARRAAMTDPLEEAGKELNQRMSFYVVERDKKEKAEQQKLIEAQRKIDEERRLAEAQRIENERKEKEAVAKLEAEALAKAGKAREAEQVKEQAKIESQAMTEQANAVLEEQPMFHAPIAPKQKAPDGLALKGNWTFEITDESLIPREYLLVNESALKATAKTQKQNANVPGVRFFQETKFAGTGKKTW